MGMHFLQTGCKRATLCSAIIPSASLWTITLAARIIVREYNPAIGDTLAMIRYTRLLHHVLHLGPTALTVRYHLMWVVYSYLTDNLYHPKTG